MGTGATIVPGLAGATRRLELQKPVALGLAAFGAFLFIGALTIIGAAVRESVLPPRAQPDRPRGWGRPGAGGGGGGGAGPGGVRRAPPRGSAGHGLLPALY